MDQMSYLWADLQRVSSELYRETGDPRVLGLQDVAMAIRFDDNERLGRGVEQMLSFTATIGHVTITVTVESTTTS
jgi:hypothetical protein